MQRSRSEIPWDTDAGTASGTRIALPPRLATVRIEQPLYPARPASRRLALIIVALAASLTACTGGQTRDGLDGGALARGVKEVMQN